MISSRIKRRGLPAQAGFTLVEMLVYAAGVVLIVGAITAMLYYSYSWYSSVAAPARADQIGTAVTDRIVDDIRGGQSVNAGGSSFNVASGALSLTALVNTSGTTMTKYYALQNGRIIYQENGGTVQYLTPSDMTVSSFTVNEILTPVSTAIRFSIGITYTAQHATTTSAYAGLAILRNSYQ